MFPLHLNSLTSAWSSIIHSYRSDSGRQVCVVRVVCVRVCPYVCMFRSDRMRVQEEGAACVCVCVMLTDSDRARCEPLRTALI